LAGEGLIIIALATSSHYWIGLVLWALLSGAFTLWNITARSLVQAMVPNELLGRVISSSRVLTWSVMPLSALLGGALIEWTQDVALIYGILGLLMILLASGFMLTPLWRMNQTITDYPKPVYIPLMNRSPNRPTEETV
jgi:hypothetical protein